MYCMQFDQYGSLCNHKLNNPALTKDQRLLMTSDKMSNLVASYDMHGSFCPARVLYPLIGQPGKTPSPPQICIPVRQSFPSIERQTLN